LSAALEKAQHAGPGSVLPKCGKNKAEVLKEVGVSTSEAHRCEQLACVPEPDFEAYLKDCGQKERVASSDALTCHFIRERKRFDEIERLNGIAAQDIDACVGEYDVIVIDPPWPMQKINRDVAPNQVGFDYPTMNEQELAQLVLPMSASCHVWLWATPKYLPMALRLLDAWGLNYVCPFVWHKPGGFQPFNLPQYNIELALYARQGTPLFTTLKDFSLGFNAPRGKHSVKPEAFYSMVRDHTAGRRLDMFARRHIEGFDGWGKEYETSNTPAYMLGVGHY
jgi:N6-adenosine-specific RNA methylase IME4